MSKDSLDSLKEKLVVNGSFVTAVPLEEGKFYKTVETSVMSEKDSKDFTDKLKPYVDFSGINKNALANNGKALEQGIAAIIQSAMVRDFGKPIVDNGVTTLGANKGHTIDETKLTPERIKAFGHAVSQEVANYSQQMELAKRTFKQCEDKGMKFSPEQKEKIMKQLTPTLNSLGSDHLEKNMDAMATDLSNKLKGNRSLYSRITGKPSVSSDILDKITVQFAKEEMPKSINASMNALQDKKLEHSTQALPSNPDQKQFSQYEASFNSRVQTFAMNNGIMNTSSKTTPQEIAKIRLVNPKAFDEAVFSQKTQTHSAEEVMHSAKGVEALEEIAHSGGTPTPKRPPPPPAYKSLPLTPPEQEKQAILNELKQLDSEVKKPRPQFLKETRQASLDSAAARDEAQKAARYAEREKANLETRQRVFAKLAAKKAPENLIKTNQGISSNPTEISTALKQQPHQEKSAREVERDKVNAERIQRMRAGAANIIRENQGTRQTQTPISTESEQKQKIVVKRLTPQEIDEARRTKRGEATRQHYYDAQGINRASSEAKNGSNIIPPPKQTPARPIPTRKSQNTWKPGVKPNGNHGGDDHGGR